MVNSNDYVSLQSYYSRRKASQEPQPQSEQLTVEKNFRQPLLQHMDTPLGSPKPELPTGAKIFGIRFLTRRQVRAHDSFSSRHTSPPKSHAADLLAYVPSFLIHACICTFYSVLCPAAVLFWVFLIFPIPNEIYRISGVVLPPVSSFKSLTVVISYFLVSMTTKGSIFSPILVASAIITLEKLVAHLCSTQASKSASIAFVAQTSNASACLSHSSGP